MRTKKPRNKRQPNKQQIELVCAELGPEDGIDPRYLRREPSFNRGSRKTLQLCKQVERELSLTLGSEFDDPALRDLQVLSVEPAPNSARMLVTVSLGPSAGPIHPAEVVAHLSRASGKLRCEIAAAIHRKKTPELAFCVVASNFPN